MKKKIKVLVIGPDIKKAKGGMPAVIKQEAESEVLNDKNSGLNMHYYASYIDGSLCKRLLYCAGKIIKGLFVIPGYDVLHVHMTAKGSMVRKSFYVAFGEFFHKRVIIQIHCCNYFLEKLKKMPRWYQRSVQKKLQRADNILCLSRSFKEKLSAELSLTNCSYLPNGIDATNYKYNQNGEGIIFLGKVREDKGIKDLIAALQILKQQGIETKTTVAGTGQIEEMSMLARQGGVNVDFVGWVDGEQKKELLTKSKILVLPSYHEGFPVVILEGMASGCEIITTDVGAAGEIVETKLKPGNTQGLAEALKIALAEKDDAQLIEDFRKVCTDFSITEIHKHLKKILSGENKKDESNEP